MINAYEDAIVKASIIKFTGKWNEHPRFKPTKSPAETGDVSGQAKANQESMMGLGGESKDKAPAQAPVDPERQSMYDKIDQISAGGTSQTPTEGKTPHGALYDAAKNIGGKAAGAIGDAAKGAKESLVGTGGDETDKRIQALTQNPNTSVEHDAGTPGMAQNAFSSLQEAGSAAKDWMGEKAGQAKDAMTGAAEKIGQGYSNMASNVVPKVDAAMMGAAEKIGQGVDSAKTWAGDMNTKYNTPENRAALAEGARNVAGQAGSALTTGAKGLGRGIMGAARALGSGAKATAQGASNLAGRMAYGAVDPATGQRTGRDASGFINPNDKLGTLGAGIKGAITGKGAMNAIEERNQKRLSTNDLNFDREAQTNLKQGVQSADAEKKWAGMPGNVHEGMEIAGQTPAATPAPVDADGDGIPDQKLEIEQNGQTGEQKVTQTTTPQPPATDGGMSSGGGGMSSGTPTTTSAAPAPAAAAPSQSNKIAENALAAEQAGKLSAANQRAGKSWADGGVGTGLASNLLTFGGAGALRHGANALTRFGGRRDAKAARTNLQGMTGANPTFTASFDSPLDEYWGLQKTMQNIRLRDSTEAIRYALQ
jgi:hypothetical protein